MSKNIYHRMLDVMAEVSYIQKEDKKVNDQYKFVSHDAVAAKVREALIKHQVAFEERILERTLELKEVTETVLAWNAQAKAKTPVLDNFCRDVSKAVEKGEIDPVVGREVEIKRVSQILSRRKKNNPVLIGEPGVGKTAIVEGLAQLIYEGNAPRTLTGKKIFTFSENLLQGTTITGILASLSGPAKTLKYYLQIALCHSLFNLFGILILICHRPILCNANIRVFTISLGDVR